MIAARKLGLKSFVDVSIESGDAPLPGFETRQKQRQLAIAGRAADQADPGRAIEDALALLLGHASKNADDFIGRIKEIIPGIEKAEAREDFLRGFFANAAGVVEHETGLLRGIHLTIAPAEQEAGHFLGVVVVHLAAESLDVKRGPGV